MSKKEIRQMSIDEICSKIDMMIFSSQLQFILTDASYTEEIRNNRCMNLTQTEVYQYIIENPEKIDKERLIFFTAWNFKIQLEQLSALNLLDRQREKKAITDKYTVAKKLLQGLNVEMPVISYQDGKDVIEEFWTVNHLLANNKSQKNFEKELNKKERNLKIVKDLKKLGLLDTIFYMSHLDDFQDYLCYYLGNGKFFRAVMVDNVSHKYKKIMDLAESELSEKEEYDIHLELYREEFSEMIEKYCHKFNMDKFLLVAAYRAKDVLQNGAEISDEKAEQFLKIMHYASKALPGKTVKFFGKIHLDSMEGKTNVEYSNKKLQEDFTRVVDGVYFSKEDLRDIRNELLIGNIKVADVRNPKIFELLSFSASEKNKLLELEPSNFEQLLRLCAFDGDEIKNIIHNEIGEYRLGNMGLLYLYEESLIEKSDIIKMYMNNHVDLSKMADFACIHESLQEEITIQRLMEYYRQAKQTPQKQKDFDRYRLLFLELKIKGKGPEEQEEIAEQIVEEIYQTDSEYGNDFKNLYQANLLPIQTLIAWNGEEIIYDLIKNSALKPRDAKTLLMSEELDLPKTCHALKISNLSDEEKLNFIFSSFNGTGNNEEEIQSQNEARMYLLQAIHVSKETVDIQRNVHNFGKRNKTTTKSKENRYVTDPVYRWQLFSELDEDCNIDLYLDGTAKVSLPNLNKVIIEKLFKSTKEGTKINYGAATYIMSQEEFYHHKDKIERDGKVSRRALVEMREAEVADRLVHSPKWGRALKENLEISQENGYSQEKLERIDTLVNRIEKARELLD